MASLADATHPARRWRLTALLRRLSAPPRHRTVAQAANEAAPRDRRTKRSYAPARDAFLENSAMRREMYRL